MTRSFILNSVFNKPILKAHTNTAERGTQSTLWKEISMFQSIHSLHLGKNA